MFPIQSIFCNLNHMSSISIRKTKNMKATVVLFVIAVALLIATTIVSSRSPPDFSKMSKEELKNFMIANETNTLVPQTRWNDKSKKFWTAYKHYVKDAREVSRTLFKHAKKQGTEEVVSDLIRIAELQNGDTSVEADLALQYYKEWALSAENVQVESDDVSLDVVLNYAKKAWEFIEKNKAVYDPAKPFYGNALPKGVTNAFELYGWKTPVAISYQMKWKNLYGITVCDLTYTVSFIPGGKSEDAKGNVGLYLDRITVIPTDVFVTWGWKADASVSISSINNAGSKTSPVAAAVVDIQFTIGALTKDVIHHSFHVRADGYWKALQ
jgi:hypothetical protein